MVNLTEREQKVVDALKDRDGGIYRNEIHSYAGLTQKEIAGVIGSLVKKGVVNAVEAFGGYVELTDGYMKGEM